MMAALDRICDSLDSAGVAGKGSSAALRAMRSQWLAQSTNIDPAKAISDIESMTALLEKVRKALSKQTESTGPVRLVPTKLAQSKILSESTRLPLGTIRVSNMNFDIPRTPETDKIMMSILKGSPGKYKQAAMEILEGRGGLIAWYEKHIAPLPDGATMPIHELMETIAEAMYHQATAA